MQLFSTIRLKTKTNCDLGTRVLLRFRQLASTSHWLFVIFPCSVEKHSIAVKSNANGN